MRPFSKADVTPDKILQIVADLRISLLEPLQGVMANLVDYDCNCAPRTLMDFHRAMRRLGVDPLLFDENEMSFAEACRRLDAFSFEPTLSAPCGLCEKDYNQMVKSAVNQVRACFDGFRGAPNEHPGH